MNKKIGALLVAMVILVCSCGKPAAPDSTAISDSSSQKSIPTSSSQQGSQILAQKIDRDTIYKVNIDYNASISFDAEGKVVQQNAQDSKTVLYDVLTGEARYQMHTKIEKTGEKYKDGSPITRSITALYNVNGELLYDYDDYIYGKAFGELLVRKAAHASMWASIDDIPKDYYSELWNPITNKTVQKNVESVHVLNKEKSVFAALDVFNNLLGSIDADGNMIKAAKNAYRTVISENRIIVSDKSWEDYESEEKYSMLDEELNVIATAKYISVQEYGGAKPLFMYQDSDVIGLMDAEGTKVFSFSNLIGQRIDFCDGEILVINKVDNGVILMKMEGTQIADKYDQIEPCTPDKYNVVVPPTRFVARAGNKIDILDRQGKVLASKEINDLNGIGDVTDTAIVFSTAGRFNGLLDFELNIVVPADKYNSLTRGYEYKETGKRMTYDLFIGRYFPFKATSVEQDKAAGGEQDYSVLRIDIFDSKLNKIANSLTEVGTISDGRIAVVRGFSAGVIDWQGNWIGKESIFQSASDERKVEIF